MKGNMLKQADSRTSKFAKSIAVAFRTFSCYSKCNDTFLLVNDSNPTITSMLCRRCAFRNFTSTQVYTDAESSSATPERKNTITCPSRISEPMPHCLPSNSVPLASQSAFVNESDVSDTESSPLTPNSHGRQRKLPLDPKDNPNSESGVTVRSFQEMPGPKGYPIIGTLLSYCGKNLGKMYLVLQQNHVIYGNVYKAPFGMRQNVCIADPVLVEDLLRSEGPYPNRPPYDSWVLYNKLRNRNGGIFTSQGEHWLKSRRALSCSLLKPQAACGYLAFLDDTADEFLERLNYFLSVRRDKPFIPRLSFEISKFTMEAVGQVLLNVRIGTMENEPSAAVQQFIKAIGVMFFTGHKLMALVRLQQLLRPWIWREHVEAWDIIYDFSNKLMNSRVDEAQRKQKNSLHGQSIDVKPHDVISNMVAAGTMSTHDIIDNLTEVFLGGVDTVANGIGFMIYLLATNQSAQDKLRDEVDSVLGQQQCTTDSLQALPFVKAIVKETLRLYPTIPINARVTQDDMVIGNYHVPSGIIVMINHYAMCRNERIFNEQSRFIPERWLRSEGTPWHPFSNIPFGYGVRGCVGKRVAENLMYVTAIKLVQKYVLRKDPSFDISPVVRTQFFAGEELPILFEKRKL